MGELVKVFVYDLSQSSSASAKSSCSEIKILSAFHTSIVVFNKEYTFNCSNGITIKNLEHQDPEAKQKILDCTRRSEKELEEFIEKVRHEWRKEDYDVLQRNCHNFCILLCEFLEVNGFPEYVRTLPEIGQKLFGSQTALIKSGNRTIFATAVIAFGGIILSLFKSS